MAFAEIYLGYFRFGIFLFITGVSVNVLLALDGTNDGRLIFILLKNSPPGQNYV